MRVLQNWTVRNTSNCNVEPEMWTKKEYGGMGYGERLIQGEILLTFDWRHLLCTYFLKRGIFKLPFFLGKLFKLPYLTLYSKHFLLSQLLFRFSYWWFGVVTQRKHESPGNDLFWYATLLEIIWLPWKIKNFYNLSLIPTLLKHCQFTCKKSLMYTIQIWIL